MADNKNGEAREKKGSFLMKLYDIIRIEIILE